MKRFLLILFICIGNELFSQPDYIEIPREDILFDGEGIVGDCLESLGIDIENLIYKIPIESVLCGYVSPSNGRTKYFLLFTSSAPENGRILDSCRIELIDYDAWKDFWEIYVYDNEKSDNEEEIEEYKLFQICGRGNTNRGPAFINELYFNVVSVYRLDAIAK